MFISAGILRVLGFFVSSYSGLHHGSGEGSLVESSTSKFQNNRHILQPFWFDFANKTKGYLKQNERNNANQCPTSQFIDRGFENHKSIKRVEMQIGEILVIYSLLYFVITSSVPHFPCVLGGAVINIVIYKFII